MQDRETAAVVARVLLLLDRELEEAALAAAAEALPSSEEDVASFLQTHGSFKSFAHHGLLTAGARTAGWRCWLV